MMMPLTLGGGVYAFPRNTDAAFDEVVCACTWCEEVCRDEVKLGIVFAGGGGV